MSNTTDIRENNRINHLQNSLAQFTGTERYYEYGNMTNIKLTDGVKWLCDNAGCYWLIDIIVSYQRKCSLDPMLQDFQIWTLKVKNSKGKVICERDTNDIAITQRIPYTDFPLPEIKLYCENEVICLPSER